MAEAAPEGPPKADRHPLVGQVIGDRYRIDALLGEGGMGAVFRATHLGLDRPVAMKVLHPRLSHDEHVAKRFDREALAVSKLDHPNCVQVIDFGTTPKGMKYLVMQLLEGRELRDMTGVALPIEQVVYFGIQVLRALEHAHKRGLVHRDLKPENIFVVEDDDGNQVVKLVDFGIVKLLEDAPQEKLTRLGMAFGTPTYMSPEQAAGGTIDARTDLYAAGVLLHELLTGAPPFEADEPGILLRMHILADPPPLPDTVPASVAAVVAKLLAKEPDDRYADAREARRALSAAYPLPTKITGVVGLAAVARDEGTDPSGVRPRVAGATPSPTPAPAKDQGPTMPDPAATRAEPTPSDSAPELFVRSGGTVLAPPTSAPSSSHGGLPIPPPMPAAATSMSHGGLPAAAASMSHGGLPIPPPMPAAAASMSHGAAPVAPASGPHFDSLAVSSPGLPVMGPGMYASGAHPRSGVHAAMPARRGSGRRNGTILVVVGVLITWVVIGIAWLASRGDDRPGPAASPSPPAGGVYRFANEDPAGSPPTGTPGASPAEASGAAVESRGEGKKAKKGKKGKRGD